MIDLRQENRCGRARDVDLAEGLQQVIQDGAPAQAARAREILRSIAPDGIEPGDGVPPADEPTIQAARDLVRAFLHDPDLWR